MKAGNHRAHRDRAVGDLLGNAHQVRGHAEAVGTEHRAGAAKARDHFVEHQQDIVLVANFAQSVCDNYTWREELVKPLTLAACGVGALVLCAQF